MRLTLNGKSTEIDHGMKLLDFINMKGWEAERIVVEHNFSIVRREDWDKVVLNENDNLEIIKFVGGG